MLNLVRNGPRYVARFEWTPEAEAHLRHAGFRLDPATQEWYTTDTRIASRMDAAPRAVAAPNAQLHLGALPSGQPFKIPLALLLATRMLIQGSSGAGKTNLIKHLLRQTAGNVAFTLIDPEGEFTRFASTVRAEVTPQPVRPVGRPDRSWLLDLFDLPRDEQLSALAFLLERLIARPKASWSPVVVLIDEAQVFAPGALTGYPDLKTRKAAQRCLASVIDLMSRGRKRGLCGIVATQRLARLNPSVRSEALNYMVGMTGHDTDIRRAADMLGWRADRALAELPALMPGQFICHGPLFGREAIVVSVPLVS